MRSHLVFSALAITAGLASTYAGEARACGGCFHPPPPPTETPTVITDHRMILSVSKDQSTLYDQIEYSGDPQSFAWVLPIAGTVDVGLSADIVFQALDTMTQTTIVAPPQNCPAPPSNCNSSSSGGVAFASGEDDSAGSGAVPSPTDPGGVVVTKREVVGPYETVQLSATDPTALEKWLASNGFTVPDDVKPIIDEYVNEKFDFLAMKLQPGQGISSMRPVRVTTHGASAVLPLRMVAAGTGATVGITLWMISEGRYEPQNFPWFYVKTEDIAWSWAQQRSDYTDLRAAQEATGGGRAWEVESTTAMQQQQLQNTVKYGSLGGGSNGGASDATDDYLPVTDPTSNAITKTAEQVRDDDLAALFEGMDASSTRYTRLRSDVAHAALDQDLVLTASADQTELSQVRNLTKESDEPLCPEYKGCTPTGRQIPRSQAQAEATAGGPESFSCSIGTRTSGYAWLGVGLGFVGLAGARGAKRLRRRR